MIFTWNNLIKKTKLKQKAYLFTRKYCENISIKYLKKINSDRNNKLLLYSINDQLSTRTIAGIIYYRIILNTPKKKRIYIPLIGVNNTVRGCGYGKIILNEIINKFHRNNILEIVLLSLPSSLKFYKKLGFQKCFNKFISNHEDVKNNYMMKLIIK